MVIAQKTKSVLHPFQVVLVYYIPFKSPVKTFQGLLQLHILWSSTIHYKDSYNNYKPNIDQLKYLPVIKSQTNILPSSKPLSTQPSLDEMSSETVFTAGFHFLNKVPDWRSYTTIKFGLGSSTSYKYTIEQYFSLKLLNKVILNL